MDLKQVAERLRKVKAAAFLCERDFAEVAKDAYGENVELELIQLDTSHAVTDWLAERDPTPLTVDALEALGFTQSSYHSHWELWSSGDGWSVKAMFLKNSRRSSILIHTQ